MKGLADIHLPPPVPAFPWAPGWWALLGAALLLAAALLCLWQRRRRRRAYRRAALAELQDIAQLEDRQQLAQALNQLLRRVALHSYPRSDIAGLSGRRWQAFLSDPQRGAAFSEDVAETLQAAAYNPQSPLPDRARLLAQAERWIRQHRSQHHA